MEVDTRTAGTTLPPVRSAVMNTPSMSRCIPLRVAHFREPSSTKMQMESQRISSPAHSVQITLLVWSEGAALTKNTISVLNITQMMVAESTTAVLQAGRIIWTFSTEDLTAYGFRRPALPSRYSLGKRNNLSTPFPWSRPQIKFPTMQA